MTDRRPPTLDASHGTEYVATWHYADGVVAEPGLHACTAAPIDGIVAYVRAFAADHADATASTIEWRVAYGSAGTRLGSSWSGTERPAANLDRWELSL